MNYLSSHLKTDMKKCGLSASVYGTDPFFAPFYFKAGILPPHPRSLVTAAKNREALAAGALSSDVLEGAEKDDEQEEDNTKDS